MGKLFIVATPIGNLGDITLRALHILEEVDLILCEDTRVTKKLLNHYNVKTPVQSHHQHSKLKKVNYILKLLREGKNLALVSDSGTPGISDPGNKLISYLVAQLPSLDIVSIPGSSAVTAAASISGFPMDKFLFFGFPPHKKRRRKFFKEVVESKHPVIFYESPHRIIKSLNELKFAIDSRIDGQTTPSLSQKINEMQVVVCRELTKKFETVYRGSIEKVIRQLEKEKIKGEFVVMVSPK